MRLTGGKLLSCVGIVGAPDAAGQEILECLQARNFPTERVRLFADRSADPGRGRGVAAAFARSLRRVLGRGGAEARGRGHDGGADAAEWTVGTTMHTKWGEVCIEPFSVDAARDCDLVLLAAPGNFSREFARQICGGPRETSVIDSSPAWRLAEDVPLVIPEINGGRRSAEPLVASPSGATAIAAMALWPLHMRYGLKKVIVSTYQAAGGAGQDGQAELEAGIGAWARGEAVPAPQVFEHQLPFNVIPQVGAFLDNGYTAEEMNVAHEVRKLFRLPDSVRISCTAVRVPTLRAHCEAMTVETEDEVDVEEARSVMQDAFGLKVLDEPKDMEYPLPLSATGVNDVQVGRIRKSIAFGDRGLDFFVAGDQVLRGAALNAVLIAEQAVFPKLERQGARQSA